MLRTVAVATAMLTLSAAALDPERPERDVRIVGGRLVLDGKTVSDSRRHGRHCIVANADGDAVICVSSAGATNPVPGTVVATGTDGTDITFRDGRNGGRLPAVFRHAGPDTPFDTAVLLSRNAFGVVTVAPVRYAREDPVVANEPWVLYAAGTDAKGAELAGLAVRAIRALPADVRRRANEDGMTALTALAMLRRAQRDVVTDADWLSGIAHRPTLDPSRIDTHRLEVLASSRRDYFVPPPAILCRDLEVAGGDIPLVRAVGAMTCRFVLQPGEKDVRVRIKADTVNYAEPKWVLLQGDPSFVRLTPVGLGYETVVEIDWKGPFRTPLATGGEILTRRVDVGCFAIAKGGEISLPAVCSFWFK